MPRTVTASLLFKCAVLAAFLAGCATPLPPSYDTVGSGRVLSGPVVAVGGAGDVVAAATGDGLFVRKGDAPWEILETPGIRKWGSVTCVAVEGETIYVGSDGEGLHIYSGGTWEVRTSRYGGLPDDGVLSIAVDDENGGLPGRAVWVGTRDGIAGLREGRWIVYEPGADWLTALSGESGEGSDHLYVGPRFELGTRGEDSARFSPPVTAISSGPDGLVMGNGNSGLAVVTEGRVATFRFAERMRFTHVVADRDVIWAGTDSGLIWGGVRGQASGKAWPGYWPDLMWSGTLFGSRDTSDFQYRWRRVGYNNAMIAGLEKRGADLWVAHRADATSDRGSGQGRMDDPEDSRTGSINDIRRYVEIDEYIRRRQEGRYESYGLRSGIRGRHTALYVFPDNRKVLAGTTKGLWELERE